jgi:hypothetical protein
MVAKGIRSEGLDGFEPYQARLYGHTFGPRLLARTLARVRSSHLDRALIAGLNPAGSLQLAARAAALTSRRSRASLAEGLERMLRAAEGQPSRRRVQPRRRQVLANAAALRELVQLLRGAAPLYATGIALVNWLVTDGTGPAYAGDGEALTRLLLWARAAMCTGEALDPDSGHRSGGASPRAQIELHPRHELPGGPR